MVLMQKLKLVPLLLMVLDGVADAEDFLKMMEIY